MPTKPKPPCDVLGCRNRKPCPEHPRVYHQGRSTKDRGYSGKHVTWFRAMVLARDPECVYHFDQRCTLVSTQADHIVPVSQGGERYDLENGAGCCAHCHAVKTARDRNV